MVYLFLCCFSHMRRVLASGSSASLGVTTHPGREGGRGKKEREEENMEEEGGVEAK